jgi:hypothetical protein
MLSNCWELSINLTKKRRILFRIRVYSSFFFIKNYSHYSCLLTSLLRVYGIINNEIENDPSIATHHIVVYITQSLLFQCRSFLKKKQRPDKTWRMLRTTKLLLFIFHFSNNFFIWNIYSVSCKTYFIFYSTYMCLSSSFFLCVK